MLKRLFVAIYFCFSPLLFFISIFLIPVIGIIGLIVFVFKGDKNGLWFAYMFLPVFIFFEITCKLTD